MYQLFLEWISVPSGIVSDDIIFLFTCLAAFLILLFLLDFLRYVMYYITRGNWSMLDVANWIFSTGLSFFNSILSDWGIIGVGILSTFLLIRVVNFMRRFFK